MSTMTIKIKYAYWGQGVLDKSVGYPVKFEFQGNNKGKIKEILHLIIICYLSEVKI